MVPVMKGISAGFLGIVSLGLSGCPYDKQYPPYLRNEADRPATLVIEYVDDVPTAHGPLAPHSNAGHADKGLVISALSAEYDNERRFELLENDLTRMRNEAGHPDVEVWILSEEGVELADKEEWERIRAKSRIR